jgi:hypothetical protein
MRTSKQTLGAVQAMKWNCANKDAFARKLHPENHLNHEAMRMNANNSAQNLRGAESFATLERHRYWSLTIQNPAPKVANKTAT